MNSHEPLLRMSVAFIALPISVLFMGDFKADLHLLLPRKFSTDHFLRVVCSKQMVLFIRRRIILRDF